MLRSRRFVLALAILLIALVVVGVLVVFSNPTGSVSGVTTGNCAGGTACVRFPTVSGENLLGETLTLPEDFEGETIFVALPFAQEQAVGAQTWLPLVQELAAEHPSFGYYNVLVFPELAPPLRTMIRGGMSAAIPDEPLRAITITLFLEDRQPFLDALAIPDAEAMQILLLDASGDVLWHGVGDYDEAQGEELRAALAR